MLEFREMLERSKNYTLEIIGRGCGWMIERQRRAVEPVIRGQYEKGRLIEAQYNEALKLLLSGKANNLLADLLVAHTIGGTLENALVLAVAASDALDLLQKVVAGTFIKSTGILSLPYFALRGVQEWRELKKNSNLTPGNRRLIVFGVVSNLIPIVSAFTSFIINIPRLKPLARTLINSKLEEINRIGNNYPIPAEGRDCLLRFIPPNFTS